MQSITFPIDIADAVRIDLDAPLEGVRVFANPAPDNLGAKSVCITQLGGAAVSPVAFEYDISVDVWEATPGKAIDLANRVVGLVASLPMRDDVSTDYKAAETNLPYRNPDPARPKLSRYTFSAIVTARNNESAL